MGTCNGLLVEPKNTANKQMAPPDSTSISRTVTGSLTAIFLEEKKKKKNQQTQVRRAHEVNQTYKPCC